MRLIAFCAILLAMLAAGSFAAADNILGLSYSLSIDQAIENALQNNKNIENVKKSIIASELQHRALTKDRYPRVETNYSYTYFFDDLTIRGEFPSDIQVDLDADGDIDNVVVKNSTTEINIPQNDYTWMTTLTLPIYTGGLQDCAEAMAKLGIDVARVRHIQARNELVRKVRFYYYSVLKDQHFIEFLEQNLGSYTEHERLTIHYHSQGLVARNSVLEAKVQKANAEQELSSARLNADISLATLKTLMVMDLERKITLEDSLSRERFPYTREECVKYARIHNPELVAFIFLKEQAEKAIRLEKSYYNPMVNLNAYYLRYGATPDLRSDPGDWFPNSTLMAMLSINFLITDWGKKHDEAEIKKVELEQVINNEKLAMDQLVLKVREAYSQMEIAEKNMKTSELAIEHAKENLRLAKLRFREQAAPSREVIDAITDLKRSEYNYFTALYAYNVAMAELSHAMGMDTEKAISCRDGEAIENERLIRKAIENIKQEK